ncbi:MAG: long-chain fatty acid--CoA ligase [Myxococcales bacterium]|nr:long-chain fatty acid--CoA ligase [Myxococcales bacterium]
MQRRACERYRDAPALGTKVSGRFEFISYAELGRRVDRFRGALARLGVGRGDVVAVIANNRVEWAVGAYATYSLGGRYVPMYEAQPSEDWEYILGDCGAKVLLVSTEAIYDRTVGLLERLPALQRVLCFEAPREVEHSYQRQLEIGAEHPAEPVLPEAEEVAGLIYTSGTTGKPKGVVLSHRNIISNVNAVQDSFPMTEDDVSCSFLPWAHSFGQTCELHVLLSRGAAIGIAQSPQTLMDDFLLVRPTLLFAVPRIFNRIYDGLQKRMAEEKPAVRWLFSQGLRVAAARRKRAEQGKSTRRLDLLHAVLDRLVFGKIKQRFGGRLRYVFSGGAALSQEVAEFIDDIGILVFEGYGLTETSPIATANRPEARRMGTVGKAIPGVEIFICDEGGRALPSGRDGEVVVVGPNVMQGYHGMPEATAEVIFDLEGKRAFRTGDMGRMDADGFVRITGRFKEQYKLENGKYVVPTPLEQELQLSGLVSQAFVFGDNRPFNVCLVVPDFPALAKWAKAEGIGDTSAAALVADERAHARIGEELARYAAGFRGYEKPKRWALLAEELTVENGLLTPKMSVKRRVVVDRYRELLDSLYAEEDGARS